MQIFLLTAAFFGAAMFIMAVGLIAGKVLQGSCGGKDACFCELTGRPKPLICRTEGGLRAASAAIRAEQAG
jgi:hypothetical protein